MTVRLLRYLPRHALTRALGICARLPIPRVIRAPMYSVYARRYGCDLEEADRPLQDYPCFQDFFARRLRANARPLSPAPVISPADSEVVSSGFVENGRLLQVKDFEYSLCELLGDDGEAARYGGGRFVTLYLHPRSYHRVHAPIDGKMVSFRQLAGDLMPVHSEATSALPRLFATNERAVSILDGKIGRVAVVKVAAFGVGNVRMFLLPPANVSRGDELATFLLGSTVVLVASRNVPLAVLSPGSTLRMGESLTASEEGGVASN